MRSYNGRFLRHRPKRSGRCLNYEKLYQGHGPLPKSQGVPEGPLRKNHVSRRLTLSDLASKVGKIAIGQILVANKDVHWVGIIDIQVHLEIGIETEQKTPFINM